MTDTELPKRLYAALEALAPPRTMKAVQDLLEEAAEHLDDAVLSDGWRRIGNSRGSHALDAASVSYLTPPRTGPFADNRPRLTVAFKKTGYWRP